MKIQADLKIAYYLRRLLNYYIRKRLEVEKLCEEKKWLKKFNNDEFFIHQLEHDILIKLYKDSLLSRLIYSGFEESEICFIKKYLKSGDIFFDIGANIGLFSLIASKMIGIEGKVYAFEPTPCTYSRLVDNITLNRIKNIEPINIGLSNKPGLLDLHISQNGYDAWNSFAQLSSLTNMKIEKVKVDTLDSYIENQRIDRVDLLKIDVEGWEKFVLEGGRKILSSDISPVLLVEFTEENTFAAGYYCGDLYDFMNSFGYEWYRFNPEDMKLEPVFKQIRYPYVNLIAIKDFPSCHNRIIN